MAITKAEFLALLSSGAYYALQKKNDHNREDISIKREDGHAAELANYPYRMNQMPAYLFDEFCDEGLLQKDGADESGGTIFRVTKKVRQKLERAA